MLPIRVLSEIVPVTAPQPRTPFTAGRRQGPPRSKTRLTLLILVILAAILRLYHLGHLSLWYDEAATVVLSRDISVLPQSLSTSAPLPFVIAHYWNLFGHSELWIRLWAALFGIALVPLIWAIGKRLFGERAGLYAAALIAVNPLFVYYSQEARAYSLLPFFIVASAYCWLIALYRRNWLAPGLCAAFSLALAFYSHYYSVLWILSIPLSILIAARTKRNLVSAIWLDAKILVISLIFVAPWLAVFYDKATTTVSVADFWVPKPGLGVLLTSLKNMSAGFQAPPTAGAIAAAIIALGAVTGIICSLTRGRATEIRFVLVNLLLPIAAAFLISKIAKNSVYLDRCLIPSAAFLMLLAGYGISTLRRSVAWPIFLVFGCLISASLYNHYHNIIPDQKCCPGVRQRKEFRQSAEYIKSQIREGDLIGHTCRSSLAPFMVYFPEEQSQVVLASSREHRANIMRKYPYKGLWASKLSEMTLPIAVSDIPAGYRRLFLIGSEWDIDKGDFYSIEKRTILEHLDSMYPLQSHKEFYGAPVYVYDLAHPRVIKGTSVGTEVGSQAEPTNSQDSQ
ncbi:MAG: glycosyltransferase family 39 protein [Candidatus Coatesbacteria bacterium]|nr:glycosyltransferase family 39 protein [Candidatus Coatesbacteria bacterium]